jgi:hypothetical protein
VSHRAPSICGTRQAISVVLPVALDDSPPWEEGPLPLSVGGRGTVDRTTRQTYLTPAAARVLYGTPDSPRRWHRSATIQQDPLRLTGMEVFLTRTARHPRRALAVLHLDVVGPHLMDVLRAIARRPAAGPDPLHGPLSPQSLLQGIAQPATVPSPYTLAFLTPSSAQPQALRPTPDAAVPESADIWLWHLASRTEPTDYPLPQEHLAELRKDVIRISADWSSLVLRRGAAFLGHRPDEGDGDFYDLALLHTRSVYLDALLLGMVQREHIDEISERLSDIFESDGLSRRLSALERHIACFRSTFWRQHLTAHGPPNDLLLAFQAQHRLPERFAEILAEAADYARFVQTRESQQISGALGILTLLGLPVGTALAVLQMLEESSPTALTLSLAAAFAATGGALTTRYGRLVLSSLRGDGPETGDG